MQYIGGGQNANSYNRVFQDGKGYAVYDSFKEDDGTQYIAVSGKNSSFIEKINLHEPIVTAKISSQAIIVYPR